MVAIKFSGVIAFEIKEGSFNGGDFISFISNHLNNHFRQNPNGILIMNNCSFHHKSDAINNMNVNSK